MNRHADADRQAVTEAAGGDLDARHARLGVSAEDAVETAEFPQFLRREEALLGEDHVERKAAMPLAQNEAVAALQRGIARVEVQHAVVEHPQNLDQRERRCEVAAAGGVHDLDDAPAQRDRALVERGRILRCGAHASSFRQGKVPSVDTTCAIMVSAFASCSFNRDVASR